MDQDRKIVVPFLKWAGGKRWLTKTIDEYLPNKFDRYIEPFLGSGAVFFHLHPGSAVLPDLNAELIETYQAIKDDWEGVFALLQLHHDLHCDEYYYEQRAYSPTSKVEAAARFIYLNRTCWNGLYRVNLSGKFNVPKGTKSKVVLDTDNFEAISEKLNKAELIHCDFEETLKKCKDGDLVFIDPPYTVKHNNNGFIKYNEKIFSWCDQVRLSECAIEAAHRGAKVIISNANHPSIRDLYAEGSLSELSRRSTLSGDKSFRGSYTELLITL